MLNYAHQVFKSRVLFHTLYLSNEVYLLENLSANVLKQICNQEHCSSPLVIVN